MRNIIILCSPTSEDFRKNIPTNRGCFFPPLGLLLVAQALKSAGYEVRFYDGNYIVNYKQDIAKYLSDNKDEILFFGFYLALLQIGDCIEIAKMVKAINKNIPIVVGGAFGEAFPNVVMNSGMIDVCCTGDGARAAQQLAGCLANNKRLHDLPNIAFMDGDKIITNARSQRDNLDEHNKIYYENFIDLESYVNKFAIYLPKDYDISIKRAIPILTGLGCSYKCSFCENALLGHKHISLCAENIVDQIVYYHEKYDIDAFAFFDEDFFIDKQRSYKLIELLGKKNLKIKWGTQCRANYFNEQYINKKMLKELAEVGCSRLCIGVESGSPRMLDIIKKQIKPEQVIRAAEYGKDSPIYFSYSFIVNLPDETREEFCMTFDLIDKITAIKKNSFVSAIHRYIAYPGTPLSIEAENKCGYKIENEFSFSRFGEISLKEYNDLINFQNIDWYRECKLFHYEMQFRSFQASSLIKSAYYFVFKMIGLIRKRLNFYHLPIEIYLIEQIKLILTELRKKRRISVKAG